MAVASATNLIVQYITSRHEDKPDVVSELAKRPEESFDAIIDFRGPYPRGAHPMDFSSRVGAELLASLLSKCPDLFLNCDIKSRSLRQRCAIIHAALITQDSQFSDGLITRLRDRSNYIKMLVVSEISRSKILQTSKSRVELERLIALPSMANCELHRNEINKALKAFDA